MIINNNRIIAARCTLPIAQNLELPPQYGLRHRAAASVTAETDAFAIVVSEETGNISFVIDGTIRTVTSLSELKLSIESAYSLS
jgi:diadenylate cyclase